MRRPVCSICEDDLERGLLNDPVIETRLGEVHLACEANAIFETFPSMSMEPASRRQVMWELGMQKGYLL